jgi:hypothetical protein
VGSTPVEAAVFFGAAFVATTGLLSGSMLRSTSLSRVIPSE